MMKVAVALCLALAVLQGATAFTWTSCGTRYDRLIVKDLDFFSQTGSFKPNDVVTVRMTGTTMLHVPTETGAWQVRVYETGAPKSISTAFGNLFSALHFTDPLNTTFELEFNFTLPAPVAENQFTASIMATNQAKATLLCIEIMYSLDSTDANRMPALSMVAAREEIPVEGASSSGPHFWSCGKSSRFHIGKIILDPAQPVPGKKVTIKATGTATETITGGEVAYKAAFDGIQLIHKTEKLCHILGDVNVTCPVHPGVTQIGVSFDIPSFAPGGNYSAIANAYDQDKNLLACLQGWFQLK